MSFFSRLRFFHSSHVTHPLRITSNRRVLMLDMLEDRTLLAFNPGTASLLQPDGRIVVAGSVVINSDESFALVRYNSNGSIDSTFGEHGAVMTNFGTGYDYATAVALQSDGKLVCVGVSNGAGGDRFAVARYNANGTPDPTFGSGGKVTTDFPGTTLDGAYDVAVQANGMIVVAGYTGSGFPTANFGLVRYTTNGSLDSTFGSGGLVSTDFGSSHDFAASVALQADGRIVAGGLTSYGSPQFGLARYEVNGALDPTFGSGGKVSTLFPGSNSQSIWDLAIQSDGKILAVGTTDFSYFGIQDAAIARYTPSGGLDGTFSGDGMLTANLGGNEEIANSVILQPDGMIVVAGTTNAGTNPNNFAVARLTNNGGFDSAFGSAGVVVTDFSNASDEGSEVLRQPDGKIVVVGRAHNGTDVDFALARYLANGSLDTSFDLDGKVLTDLPLPPAPTPAPLTIITHGLVLPVPFIDSEPPSWTHSVRESLADRGLDSVVFDWANESNNPSPGWAEAAGDELFARIMWDLQLHRDVAPQNLHFIGHSRGTVVNSEANRRLAHYQRAFEAIGAAVGNVQFTMLDSHPANNKAGFSALSLQDLLSLLRSLAGDPSLSAQLKFLIKFAIATGDVTFETVAADPDPVVWSNVAWADSYFQRTNVGQANRFPDTAFNLWGYGDAAPWPWSDAPFLGELGLNANLTSKQFTPIGGSTEQTFSHSQFGDWYLDTIRRDAAPTSGSTYNGGGWHYSMGGAGWSARPRPERPDGLDPTGPVSVFNGSFAYSTEFDSGIPGWDGSGAFEVVGASNEMQLRTTLLSPFRAAVTHNPLFIPPRSEALRFTITNDATNSPTSMLNVYFLPATFDVNGQLVPDESRKVLMQSWRLGSFGDLTIGTTTKTLALPDLPGPLGAVGSFQFELLTPGLLHKSVVTIDDVELVRGGMTRRFGNNNGYEGMPRVSISPSFLVQATESQAYRSVGDRWTATLPYEARIGNLSEYLRTRVTDDFTPDKLLGGEGRDWFFVSLTGLFPDRLLDPIADDLTTDITGW